MSKPLAETKEEDFTCGICTYESGEVRHICSLCGKHLCKGVSGGDRTVCSPCLVANYKTFKRDGRILLDPGTGKPLTTCECGKPWYPMSPCLIISLQTKDTDHGMIRLV